MARFAFACSLLALAAACGSEPAVDRLRIGMNPWPGYAHLAVAQRCGAFAAQGLEVQIVEYASLHDLRRGFDLGQIDVLPSTLVEVLDLRQRSTRQPEIVWVADSSLGGDVVMARHAADVAGLRGQRIAFEPATLGAYMLSRMLERSGLGRHDVQAVTMDQPRMVTALRDGRIDAAITYPPYSQDMAAVGARQVFSSRELPDEVLDTISIDRSLLDRDPTLLGRFQAAMVATHDYMRTHPGAARAVLNEVSGLHGKAWDEAVAAVRIYGPDDQPAWIWQTERIEQLAARLLRTLHAGAPAVPDRLTAAHRPLPAALQPASPR